MEPIFKLASELDIEKLLNLMREFYAHENLSFEERTARSGLQLILKNDYGQINLIQIDHQVIGYLVVTFGFSLEFGGRDAFVDEVYIQAPYQRQGIGKKTLELAEEICREREIQALHLEVAHENSTAQSMYQKAGFTNHNRHLLTKKL